MARESMPMIRNFRPTDLPALKSLIHRTIGACCPSHYCAEAVRFFLNYHDEAAILGDAQEGHTIVLERAGRIFGTGTWVGEEIKRVFVNPVFQKLGLGRLIIEQLERAAARRGIPVVRLDASLRCQAFYDRLGYATIERAFLKLENTRRLEFFRMQKVLEISSRAREVDMARRP
jgi:GNAT superfamily N-acetyltransferase